MLISAQDGFAYAGIHIWVDFGATAAQSM